MNDFGSRFEYTGLYDPEWVLGQIKAGFPNLNEAERTVALENACHALKAALSEIAMAKRLAREICGEEE